ncbi:hypothetical protein Tco_0088354 [Tanacetum coccineum]
MSFVGLTRWKAEKNESVFNISGCAVENQVKFATCTLLGAALTWWNGQIRTLGPKAMPDDLEDYARENDGASIIRRNVASSLQHWGHAKGSRMGDPAQVQQMPSPHQQWPCNVRGAKACHRVQQVRALCSGTARNTVGNAKKVEMHQENLMRMIFDDATSNDETYSEGNQVHWEKRKRTAFHYDKAEVCKCPNPGFNPKGAAKTLWVDFDASHKRSLVGLMSERKGDCLCF